VGQWAAPYDDRVNELVFIGRDMDRVAIEAAFDDCMLSDAENAAGVAAWRRYADPFPDWMAER
jgi:hypothetical protein